MQIVEIRNLSYKYPDGTQAINDISMNIKSGKKVAILGANGSGKSTLLQHLNGLILPQGGSIKINGINIEKKNLLEIRKNVGFVFDNPDNQLFAPTVLEDLAFGPRNLGLGEDKVVGLVHKILDLIGIKDLKDKQPHNLSLGQKRKVAIGGVLAMEPDILIFDEPFSGLDPQALEQFLEVLNTLYEMGKSLVITTHDVDIAYEWADEIIILKRGKVLKQGSIELLEDEELLKKANLSLPILCKIFKDFNLKARSVEEAREVISRMCNLGGSLNE